VRANSGDTSLLDGLLSEVEEEERTARPGPPRATRRGGSSRVQEEELTTEEHLNNEVGYLFPGGIHGELLERIIDIDRSCLGPVVKQMCRENGISNSKDKKVLVAKLLAQNLDPKAKILEAGEGPKIHIARVSTAFKEADEVYDYFMPKGTRFPLSYTEIRADYDNIGWVTYTFHPTVGYGHIEVVNVAPAYRSRGFGIDLLQFAIDDMRGKGITTVSVSAWSKEGAALFKKLGFSYEPGSGDYLVKRLSAARVRV